ncbi:transketolase [candidate division KSB3 bacterium]|uniref:Transketolase n=1 Tax=candidate division KSB3 bacterium TaxID=2044937 RepID=A0A9D5JXP8_9BACT|nr:transketolase [candidate division KSB3 bacterium]MBD3325881.1 transketolase [candidate division KSB3 bacterium]
MEDMKTMTATHDYLMRKGVLKLLEIKDSDIRIMDLEQCRDAVDKGIHIGGAFSAVVPLVSLFYGGVIDLDIVDPTRRGQDMFVLSKGHAVATVASIQADLGYFDRSVLKNSRSEESILNGHPGPILPGTHISTGPLGQGFGVAQGFALVGKQSPNFDVFCMSSDGEFQEGTIWESTMFSGYKKLDNLCVLIDKNSGQLDDPRQLVVPLPHLHNKFEAFGWRVFDVDATQYGTVFDALHTFKFGHRDGRPTLIICHTTKGYGGFSDFMVRHKVNIPDELTAQEIALQEQRRAGRVAEFVEILEHLDDDACREQLLAIARDMHLDVVLEDAAPAITPIHVQVQTKQVPVRDKTITYDANQLPRLDPAQEYSCSDVIIAAMKVFARDARVASIDSDLASTSGLETGIGFVDRERALNAGVAEANMMCLGEAFAAMGYNAWVSTFCPFFDWKVLRRIAVGYQERLEAIEAEDGWLSEGHGLDLTFLATAPNFETKTNGATHMGTDDIQVFDGIAHLKIIDISCPNQLLAAMKWIMAGNQGLVYMRIMRAPSGVIYDHDVVFEFGKGYVLRESSQDKAVIISSGRGVHEALAAAKHLEQAGISVGVVDMPSIDEQLLLDLYNSGKYLVIAEQNNGYIWSECRKILCKSVQTLDTTRLIPINTLDKHGKPQFIHSATYEQLMRQFGLTPEQLAETIKTIL